MPTRYAIEQVDHKLILKIYPIVLLPSPTCYKLQSRGGETHLVGVINQNTVVGYLDYVLELGREFISALSESLYNFVVKADLRIAAKIHVLREEIFSLKDHQ